MGAGGRYRLSTMMALLYAVQGAWWPMLAVHLEDLHIPGRGRGWIFATLAIASIVTPLFVGQLADRKAATQKILALIYGIGTFLLALLASGIARGTGAIFGISLLYWLVTAPGLGLGASLALRNLARPQAEFGGVRLWGTVGWMMIGWVVSAVMFLSGSARGGQGAYEAIWVATAVSASVALFCLTLPNTPPLAKNSRAPFNVADALSLARSRPVATYLLVAFGVCLTTPFVYQGVPPYLRSLGLPRSGIALAMTLGQTLEIVALTALPWLLNRYGIKVTLALGIGAWVAYFTVLAARLPLLASLVAIPLNGVAITFFHIAGQMYVDSQAPAQRRAGAQCLFVMATSGAGNLLGSLLAGEVTGWLNGDHAAVFWVPCLIDVSMLLILLVSFRPGVTRVQADDETNATAAIHPRVTGALAGAHLAPASAES